MAKIAAPKLKLTYFDAAGRAEATRLALHLGGIAFEDERLTHQEFAQRKASLVYGKIPVLEVDGVQMAQSQAMLRYAGKLAGLYPVNDPLAALKVDEILGGLDELTDKISVTFHVSDPDQLKTMRLELAQVTIPRYLRQVEARLAKLPDHEVFQDRQIFIHDLMIYVQMRQLASGRLDHIPTDLADGYPLLNAAYAKVLTHPKVQQWNAAHSQPSPPQLKLTYFNGPGRAEPIRLALTIGGIPFEDERIDHAELEKRRASLPFGQVPVLEVDGEVISQSMPILRYVGALTGLYPTNDPVLALRVDEILSWFDDVFAAIVSTIFIKDLNERIKARQVLMETKLLPMTAALDRRITSWGGPFATGDALTIADLVVYNHVGNLKRGNLDGFSTTSTDQFAAISRVYSQVRAHDKVKDIEGLAQY